MRRCVSALLALLASLALLAVPEPAPVSAAVGDTDLEVTVVGVPAGGFLGLFPVIDWTVTVTNSTADQASVATATGVRIRDVLVASPTPTTPRGSPVPSVGSYDGTGTWTIPTLAPGAVGTLTFRSSFNLLTSPSATLSAEVTVQGQRDLDSGPAEDTDVGDQDDEAVFRTGTGTNNTVGDLVWNDLDGNGRYAAPEPGVRGVQVIVRQGSTRIFAGRTGADGTWSYPGVPDEASVIVTFLAPAGATFTTSKTGLDDAVDSDPDGSGSTAARTISVSDVRIDAGLRFPADLSLTLGFTPPSGPVPLTTTGTIRITNAGPGPAGGVVSAVRIPGGTTLLGTPSPTQGTTSATATVLTWTVGTIPVGATVTLTYQLRVTAVGTYESVAHVTEATTSDPDSSPNPVNASCPPTGEDDCATVSFATTAAVATGTIAGTVWRDTSRDGQRQPGESGQAGVTIRLRSVPADAVIATTITGADGAWSSAGVAAGSYVVEVLAPNGSAFTVANVGSDATDSDVAVATGRAAITVTAGATTAVDAGIVPADAPTPDTVLVPQGVTATFNVLDNDGIPGRSAGGALPSGWSWARPTAPAWASVTCTATGACTLVPVTGYAGADSFTYTLTNPVFGARTVTVTIDVLYVNDPPVARDDRAVTTAGSAVVVSSLANDEDPNGPADASNPDKPGDSLVVSAVSSVTPGGAGAVSCGASSCSFTPTAGFTGVAQFTYTARDTGISDARVDDVGVPGGLSVTAPRTAAATVRVWVDPAARAVRGFSGSTRTTTLTGAARWVLTSTVTPVASCSAGRPRITLTWTAAPRATTYVLERQSTVGGPWVALTRATGTSFVDDVVGEGTTYRYRVTPHRHRWAGVPGATGSASTPVTANPAGCA